MLWRSLVENAAQAMKHLAAFPLITSLLALAVCTGASREDPTFAFSGTVGSRTSASRWCRADELLPQQVPRQSALSPEWSTEVVEPPYGCDCSFYKSRYFCPSLGDKGNPAWVPQAVADGVCKSVTRFDLRQAPLPPDFKVLVYGNSFLRQVVEGMMCMFHDKVETKRVRYHVGNGVESERTVPGEAVCRDCWGDRETLNDRGCISYEQQKIGCPCADDLGEFTFDNGAILHYYFANMEADKSLSDSLPPHGNVTWSWYDAVFANQGNGPPLSPDAILAGAAELHEALVPFFWLNTYWAQGDGDVGAWEGSRKSQFQATGAKHVRIDAMTKGMFNLTKQAVESNFPNDPHFCLPGPPDEMALLLMKIMWAIHFEA
eukprot:g10558.t1